MQLGKSFTPDYRILSLPLTPTLNYKLKSNGYVGVLQFSTNGNNDIN